MFQTLFQKGHGGFKIFDVLLPFVTEHLFGGLHLPAERHGELVVAPDILPYALPLVNMASGRLPHGSRHLLYGVHSVAQTLVNDVERQFSHVLLAFLFFLYILNEFLAFRPTALVKPWIDVEFVGIYQLCHRHSQQQRLTVAFGNTEAAQQFGSNLASVVIGSEQIGG